MAKKVEGYIKLQIPAAVSYTHLDVYKRQGNSSGFYGRA